jgi:hypothetical protein
MSDGGLIMALADPNAQDVIPYKTKPRDKGGNAMPDRLWELVQWCFKHEASERPAVPVIADIISEMKHSTSSGTETSDFPVPGGSGTVYEMPDTDSSSSSAIVGKENATPSPSQLNFSVLYGKGKQRAHPEARYATVRFGPLNLDGDPESPFYEIVDGLVKVIRKDVLVRPLAVEKQGEDYLELRFGSLVEANNFAMTWMVYRYDPYKEVSAVLDDV